MWLLKSMHSSQRRRQTLRLQLEALEDRLVPSVADGTILVTDTPFGNPGAARGIIGVDPSTGQQSLVSTGGFFVEPLDLREGSDHLLYVADAIATGLGAVIQVDPDTGAQRMIASGGQINVPQAIEIEHGKIFLANGRGRSLVAIDPGSGGQVVVSQGGNFSDPDGLAAAEGPYIYVGDAFAFGSGAIFKVNLVTGAQTVVASGGYLNSPTNIALDEQGRLIVSQSSGSVVRVDPRNGAQTLISSGGLLGFLNGDAVESSGEIAASSFYFGNPPSALIGIDPVTGNQRTISQGGYFDFEGSLTVFHTGPVGGLGPPGAELAAFLPQSPAGGTSAKGVDGLQGPASLSASSLTIPQTLPPVSPPPSFGALVSGSIAAVTMPGQGTQMPIDQLSAGLASSAALDAFFAHLTM